jgi:hypothetical protein
MAKKNAQIESLLAKNEKNVGKMGGAQLESPKKSNNIVSLDFLNPAI